MRPPDIALRPDPQWRTRRLERRLRLLQATDASFILKKQPAPETHDLIEMRRQLTALRSQYSHNHLITALLNRFLVKTALLTEPTDTAHEQYLRSEFEYTLMRVKATGR